VRETDLHTRVLCWLIDRSGRERIENLSLDRIRARRNEPVPHWWPASLLTGAIARTVRITARDVVLPDRTARLRVYTPTRGASAPLPLVVFFHGGGWVWGDPRSYDAFCSQVARRIPAVVVSADYRLAPEHRMPTAAEDAYAATVWLAENAEQFGADRSRLAVAGDSAGGNLAAVVAILARDRGGPSIAHQVLIYPGTDGTLSSPSLQERAHGPILTLASVRAYRSMYLGPDGDARDIRMSPLLAQDLSGLPPALVQSAELDPLRDDASRYAQRLRGHGTPVRYTEYVGAPHGYISIPGAVRGSAQAMAEIVTELRAHLHGQ
jgi:acetyl esterase